MQKLVIKRAEVCSWLASEPRSERDKNFFFFAWPHAHLSISPYIKSPSSIRLIAIHFRIRLFDSVTDLCDVGTKKKQLNGRYRVYICWFQPTNVLKGRQRLFLSFFGRRIFFFFRFVETSTWWWQDVTEPVGGTKNPEGKCRCKESPPFFLSFYLCCWFSFFHFSEYTKPVYATDKVVNALADYLVILFMSVKKTKQTRMIDLVVSREIFFTWRIAQSKSPQGRADD